MPNRSAEVVTVVAGVLDPLMGRGLVDVLREDEKIQILAADLDRHALECAVAQREPRVAVVGETAGERLLARLKSSEPAPAVVVIAHSPTPGQTRRLLASIRHQGDASLRFR
jgi:hypothetical protein